VSGEVQRHGSGEFIDYYILVPERLAWTRKVWTRDGWGKGEKGPHKGGEVGAVQN